jgi:hypothetical protein
VEERLLRLTSWALSGSHRSVKFDGNGDTGFEGATTETYGVLGHGTERQRVFIYRAGKEIAIYSKKKEFEHIPTSVSTSREIGGGRQWVGGLNGLTASLPNAGTSDR